MAINLSRSSSGVRSSSASCSTRRLKESQVSSRFRYHWLSCRSNRASPAAETSPLALADTGFEDFDLALFGWLPGDLSVLVSAVFNLEVFCLGSFGLGLLDLPFVLAVFDLTPFGFAIFPAKLLPTSSDGESTLTIADLADILIFSRSVTARLLILAVDMPDNTTSFPLNRKH